MGTKSFYEEKNPEEALGIYLKSHRNLYDDIKVLTIKRMLFRFYPKLPGLEILEIGPGGGIWTKYFLGKGAKVTAVDISEPILKANQANNPGAEFILGDATTVKINEKFDLVFAKDVIEHIQDDEKFLANMKDHLKEGGRMLINTQNNFSKNYFVQGGFHRLKGNGNWLGWDPTHIRFYNFISLKNKLAKTGFKPEKWFGSYYFPYRLLTDHFGRCWESKLFCGVEILNLFNKIPFNVTGWNIGVIASKINNKSL